MANWRERLVAYCYSISKNPLTTSRTPTCSQCYRNTASAQLFNVGYVGCTNELHPTYKPMAKPIHVNCWVRQGCPLSMLLSWYVLTPTLLNEKLTAPPSRDPMRRPEVITYADDITFILWASDVLAIVQEALKGIHRHPGRTSASPNLRQWSWVPGTLRIPLWGHLTTLNCGYLGCTCPQLFTNQWPLAGRKSPQIYELRRMIDTAGISPCTADCNIYRYTCDTKHGIGPNPSSSKYSIRTVNMACYDSYGAGHPSSSHCLR